MNGKVVLVALRLPKPVLAEIRRRMKAEGKSNFSEYVRGLLWEATKKAAV